VAWIEKCVSAELAVDFARHLAHAFDQGCKSP